ncbi:MAG TPA: bifunctional acetate--CoA ligase family protein/GNAT family N-acetyltransferase [Terriglobales bacterium]|nr:bifunctional acetate--CoA ligase family protein/GNAT family N-acetyltransferase [Terriglobales bacterium]
MTENLAGLASGVQDPSHDVLHSEPRPLGALFNPGSVAVIGATEREGSVGRAVVSNLRVPAFQGKVYPVNPQHRNILGLVAYPSIREVPEAVDLAVIATPAATVPAIVGECVSAGVKSGIVISAGFRERGAEGQALETQIAQELKRGHMRLIGPNCLGVMNPRFGLNATFAQTIARPGNVAFLSQSGALQTAILDWSLREQVGFSGFVSTGSMLDIGWGDLIDYFGDDPGTQSILIYMESIGDARAFLSAAREVTLSKPIIVLKAGRSEAASKAAASHTGALTGSDDVLEAAFRRAGVLRVNSISDLFYMAEVLSKQPRPRGPKLTILTNAGGPAVLATDTLIATGGELAALSAESRDALNRFLPAHWSHGNPIDILGDADAERYQRAAEIALADPNSDGLLVILAPQGMMNPADVAERLKPHAHVHGKPLLASWMGGASVADGEVILNTAGIPTFAYPDTAARIFTLMWRYAYNLRGIYETPVLAEGPQEESEARRKIRAIIEEARSHERTLLTEYESKQILKLCGIPAVETRIARSEEEAAAAAAAIGFPVVLKLHSETITHKTDVGGVKLNLVDAVAVRQAYRAIESSVTQRAGGESFQGVTVQPMLKMGGYELIVGSTTDAQFGPVVVFGSGGELVEVYSDRALALPPLNTTLAHRLLEQTRIFKALSGVRGRKPVDIAALEALLVRFSRLIVDNPAIKEADINPLVASADRIIALDARFVLHDKSVVASEIPKPAIRPYPVQYVSPWTMKGGTPVTLRPIVPEDEPLMVKFHEALSERSVFLRYFQVSKLSQRVAHDRLRRICFLDYDREIAIVADHTVPDSGEHEILAIGRLSKLHGKNAAEVALLVRDEYQHRGLGIELLRRLIQVARDEHLDSIQAYMLSQNIEMRNLIEKLGFQVEPADEDGVHLTSLSLNAR